jgi:tRNA U34 2-thiouridine synthase MnmA/TrmU
MNELQTTLVSKIVEHACEAEERRNAAVEEMRKALRNAVATGHYLIEAKQEVGHGNWVRWFDENIRSNTKLVSFFDIRTAQLYMKLTTLPQEVLDKCPGKKEAYIALNMWHRDESQHINRDPQGTNWIGILSNLTVKIEHLFDTRPISEWEEHERKVFIERARPVVKRYVEAGGTL